MIKILCIIFVSLVMCLCGGANLGAAITNFKKGEYGSCGINMFFSFLFAVVLVIYILINTII
jgi:hypothetical protein